MLIDTHTHLYSEQFENDIDEVIARAKQNGVERFYLPAIDKSYTNRMLKLENQHQDLMFAMMGVHPCSVHPDTIAEELSHVREWIDKRPFKAIGEIGIDLYWEKEFLKTQQDAFKTQISWAKEKNLPIVIHCRDAFNEIFEVLEEVKDEQLFGIFHCFSGTKEQAQRAIDFNLKLGIGGIITFKNGRIDQFLGDFDLQHIVLETDSPYLAPVPFRGKRNESSYLAHVCDRLVDVYHKTPTEIAAITTKNALDIFER
ncbi:hydrolase TatD [Empedobacter brevis]|uniref:TatD family hydrolase n=1 Tax=Empedobacter brevis TaxID=247 RepID=UPI00131F607A|nr:TatD family hydrolase [Empedobacter brevis]QHC85932.1 hydrolase TatD [Empedobacter brevis]